MPGSGLSSQTMDQAQFQPHSMFADIVKASGTKYLNTLSMSVLDLNANHVPDVRTTNERRNLIVSHTYSLIAKR